MEWADGLNIVSGDNGQGKTNLLEAVFFLAMARSFRVARADTLPLLGEGKFHLAGVVESGGVRHELSVEAGRGVRERRLDGKAAALEETLGVFSCLAFASSRLEFFGGGPEARRRFIDRGVIGSDPARMGVFREHARALKQKNELLRMARSGRGAGIEAQVTAFNRRLAAVGAQVRTIRAGYVERLQKVLEGHPGLSALVPGGMPRLEYRPHPRLEGEPQGDALEAALAEALEKRLPAEMARGFALAGPQRDDLSALLDGSDLCAYGSSGQQRATLIALKVAKMVVQKDSRGAYPLFLVDDVDSELDSERTRRALDLLEAPDQVVVASARGPEWLRDGREARHFGLHNGIIQRLR